jgi:hypothetical protein
MVAMNLLKVGIIENQYKQNANSCLVMGFQALVKGHENEH